MNLAATNSSSPNDMARAYSAVGTDVAPFQASVSRTQNWVHVATADLGMVASGRSGGWQQAVTVRGRNRASEFTNHGGASTVGCNKAIKVSGMSPYPSDSGGRLLTCGDWACTSLSVASRDPVGIESARSRKLCAVTVARTTYIRDDVLSRISLKDHSWPISWTCRLEEVQRLSMGHLPTGIGNESRTLIDHRSINTTLLTTSGLLLEPGNKLHPKQLAQEDCI